MGLPNRWTRVVLAALLAACSASAFSDELTDRARSLLTQRQAKQAYELLLPQESSRAGDPEYDYLLGIAALDAGEYERAVFALERVLAVQPDNHLARAEIARAYLALGEADTAKREFEAVRRQPIPADARATIDKFLSAIAATEITQVAGYIELGAGYDTNVNSATGSTQIALPILPGISFVLDPTSRQRADTFSALSGGVSVTHKVAPEWAIVGGASAAGKLHEDEKNFDTLTLDANLGGRWTRGKNAVTVGAQWQSFELDWARFRESRGVIGQWQHNYDEARQATVFGQHSQLRYPSQTIRNADRDVVGVAYGQALAMAYTPVVFGSAYGARERELSAGVPHLGHTALGARIGGQARLGAGWSVFANASYERRRYGGPDPVFLETRTDRQTDVGGGASYLFRPGTTLVGQVNHTDNRSNIDLNRFKRTVVSFAVRFSF